MYVHACTLVYMTLYRVREISLCISANYGLQSKLLMHKLKLNCCCTVLYVYTCMSNFTL